LKQKGYDANRVEIVYNAYEQANHQKGTHFIDLKYELGGTEHFARVTLIANESKIKTEVVVYSISAVVCLAIIGVYTFKKKKR